MSLLILISIARLAVDDIVAAQWLPMQGVIFCIPIAYVE